MSAAPVSLGFLRPDPSRFSAAEPEVTYGQDLAVVDGSATEWDYNAHVRVEWRIVVDLAGVAVDCGLGDESKIHAVISWHSTRTNLRGSGSVVTIVDGENILGFEIPGEVLGGTLNLTLTVALGEAGINAGVFAPRRPGSPLWATRSPVVLEGAAARMPVMAVDFEATGRGRDRGLWLLECDHDLTASVTGALLLYVNAAHPDIQNLLDRPSEPVAGALARFIAYDVTRQLVVRALQHDELDERHRYDEGSVGALFLMLLSTLLPGRSVDQIRCEFEDDPGEIEAEVLSRAWGIQS